MARVKFTPNLKRFFPDLRDCEVEANTIAEAVRSVDQRWRGLGDYIVDEQGALRKHVNIFVGDDLIPRQADALRRGIRRIPHLHHASAFWRLIL